MQHDKEIDTRGPNCPLPILRAKKALTGVQTGHALLSHAEANGEFTFFMRKK